MNKIVYFPSMNPPNNDWLKTSLLFYDKIGAITPENFINDGNIRLNSENRFEEHTKFLHQKKHIELIESFYKDDINRDFEREMDAMFEKIEEHKEAFNEELESGSTAKFYYGKLTGSMIQKFQTLNLIKTHSIPNQYEPDCYYIPKSIGQSIMYNIANKIGQSDGYVPSTDKKEYTYKIKQEINPLIVKQEYEEIIMKNIFPIPVDTELEQVLKFKSKYEKELRNYRSFLETFFLQTKFVKENEIQKYMISKHMEINKEVDRLIEIYNDEGLNKITYNDWINAIKILSGPFGLKSTAINGAYNLIRRNKIPEKTNQLSYAALYNYYFVNNEN